MTRRGLYLAVSCACLLGAGIWFYSSRLESPTGHESGAAARDDQAGQERGHPRSTAGDVEVRAVTSASASLWRHLDAPEVIEEQSSKMANDRIRRSFLVRTKGKYPLVVIAGSVPADKAGAGLSDLVEPVAMVADQLMIKPAHGVSAGVFKAAIASMGWSTSGPLSEDGAWLVKLPAGSLQAVDDARHRLESHPLVAYAEPDYLVVASDLPGAVDVRLMEGQLVREDSAQPLDAEPLSRTPVLDAGFQLQANEQLLSSYPAGSRVLTFDAPLFVGGTGNYNPSTEEQNFIISAQGGVYVQGAYTSGYPNNGTHYVRDSSNFIIRHRDGIPFALHSLDLSEYSTVFAYPATIYVYGTKQGGGSVGATITTDGTIDGTGPLADFQTFQLPSTFTNLTSVTLSGNFMLDNVVVQAQAQESIPPTLEPPLVYDVTFDPPKHVAGQQVAVSGAFAPSSINFGTPTVRTELGTLSGQALELKGSGYQQIWFALNRQAAAYDLEFDAWLDSTRDLTVHFDGSGVQRLDIKSNGYIGTYQASGNLPAVTGYYPAGIAQRKQVRIKAEANLQEKWWKVSVDGVKKFEIPFFSDGLDLTGIRFHTSDTGTGFAGIDNVRISSYGSIAPAGPKLVPVTKGLAFFALPIGNTHTWYATVANGGQSPLTIQTVTSTNPQFRVNPIQPISVLPGGRFTIPVTFAPTSQGSITGELVITSDDPELATFKIPLSGTGLGVPSLTLAPATLNVSMTEGSSGTRTFTLGNAGDAALQWNLVTQSLATNPELPTDPASTANDPRLVEMWALRAPSAGVGGIDTPHAWTVTTGAPDTLIAVVDTGVDQTHSELQGNVWTNPGEVPANGVDDDANGYIDDVNGWDFCYNDASPSDVHGHGTHVAGTIAARGNNGDGIAGVCWQTKILPIKFLSDTGSGSTSDAVKAIAYATKMGAKVSNNSWGGAGYSQALYDAISNAAQAGSLFVAAAGNANQDTDVTPHYPSSYALNNIVSVAATDASDQLAYFSNYGAVSVDLGAPGSDILSLRPGGGYRLASGTSMAAPHVSGVAGLLLAKKPDLKAPQLKSLLMFGCDSLGALGGGVASQGRLNAYKSLKSAMPEWLRTPVVSGSVASLQSVQIPLTISTEGLAPGTYTQNIVISSNDPIHKNTVLPVVLNVLPNQSYNQWLVSSFASDNMLSNEIAQGQWSDQADADGDGVCNLLEYLTGNSPVAKNTLMPVAVRQEGNGRIFEFNVRCNDPYVDFGMEWSDSLNGTWYVQGLEVIENSTAGMPEGMSKLRVRISDPQPAAAFFRLTADRKP